jgi:hypothetical protein
MKNQQLKQNQRQSDPHHPYHHPHLPLSQQEMKYHAVVVRRVANQNNPSRQTPRETPH